MHETFETEGSIPFTSTWLGDLRKIVDRWKSTSPNRHEGQPVDRSQTKSHPPTPRQRQSRVGTTYNIHVGSDQNKPVQLHQPEILGPKTKAILSVATALGGASMVGIAGVTGWQARETQLNRMATQDLAHATQAQAIHNGAMTRDGTFISAPIPSPPHPLLPSTAEPPPAMRKMLRSKPALHRREVSEEPGQVGKLHGYRLQAPQFQGRQMRHRMKGS